MRRNLLVSLGVVTVAFLLLIISCKKINLATDVGQGLIPEVDNIHTFDTVVEVQTYNNLFTALNDTFRTTSSYEQFLGVINNDPLFGKTDARLYFQVGAPSAKFMFPNVPSKLFLDSVVLTVPFVETYGDSLVQQTIQASEISQSVDFKPDSFYNVRDVNFSTTSVLGTATMQPQILNDSTKFIYGKDTVKSVHNLRVRLDNSFGQRLMAYATTNAYYSDSAFKKYFKGFALESIGGGNAAIGLVLSGAKLTLHYRYEKKDSVGKFDTTHTNFSFVSGIDGSANYIGRDYSGFPVAASAGDNVADAFAYVQNTPGTYTLLKIPALANMGNRIIHLAQLQAEEIYDPSDTLFYAPRLFIDAVDNTGKNFNLPYVFNEFTDFTTSSISQLGLLYFGYTPNYKTVSGNAIKYWNFNLTRYVQNVVNKKTSSYDLRLYAKPFISIKDTVESNFVKTPVNLTISMNQSKVPTGNSLLISPLVGRVRLGGGTHPTQKMKMRIVYSKI